MRSVAIVFWAMLGLSSVMVPMARADRAERSAESTPRDRAAAESRFAETLSGCVLIGVYTIDGDDAPPHPDRYEIVSVKKHDENTWTFVARYGKLTMPPLNLPVKWAGDTPVIALDNVTIPLLGTFDCRVMFDGRRYAGTWQHGVVGGHMWGRIEKTRSPVKAPRPVPARN